MTGSDLQDMIINGLIRGHGGTRRRWRIALGPVRVLDRSTHAPCNWSVAPAGTARENDAIERLLDDVRVSDPLVKEG